MSFSLNSDACFHFIRDIFPALRDRAGIRFRVIGACPPAMRKKLKKHAGVEVTGKVRKIGDGIKDAFCGVCSVRGGAGMQNKVLNYMALGLPCVTSHVGFEGIGAVPGRDLFVYHQPDDAVDLILKLHANPDLRRETAAHARRFIEGAYDWNILYRSIREEVAQLAAGDWVRTAVG
jgi:glycosyltransferase involved in cell wall biosynthesis